MLQILLLISLILSVVEAAEIAVTVTRQGSSPTSLHTATFIITFEQAVDQFSIADIQRTNGATCSHSLAGNGESYSYFLSGCATSEVVTVTIPLGAEVTFGGDTVGPAASDSIQFEFDPPLVTVARNGPELIGGTTASFTITFSEPVFQFTVAKVTVTGTASCSKGLGGSGPYTLSLSNCMSGVATVSVEAGVVADQAGNLNTASAPVSVTIDSNPPLVTITSNPLSPTRATSAYFLIGFSESVSGFTLSDILFTPGDSCTKGLTGTGASYNLSLSNCQGREYRIDILSGVATDAAGNGNNPSGVNFTFDFTSPSVEVTRVTRNPTNTATATFTIAFSEAVTGFVLSDVTISNGANCNSSLGGSGSTYTLTLQNCNQNGNVSVEVLSTVAVDLAGNSNLPAALPASLLFDFVPPQVTISRTVYEYLIPGKPADGASFQFSFSEPVVDFDLSKISLTGGTSCLAWCFGNGTVFNMTLYSCTSDEDVLVRVLAGATKDSAGNGNIEPFGGGAFIDVTRPQVSVFRKTASPINTGVAHFDIVFSEPVVDFTMNDVRVVNGHLCARSFGGSHSWYTFNLTGCPNDEWIQVGVNDSVTSDPAGNLNRMAVVNDSVVFDFQPPTVLLYLTSRSPNNTGVAQFRIEFSEQVLDFEVQDVLVVNETVCTPSLTGSGSLYFFNVAGCRENGTILITIPADVAHDAATNGNLAPNYARVLFDFKPPLVTLTLTTGSPATFLPASFDIEFNEPVFGFSLDDVSIFNGGSCIANLQGNGALYTLTLDDCRLNETISVFVDANVARDNANNLNLPSLTVASVILTCGINQSIVCREAVDSCDVLERCNGVNVTCPADVGLPCSQAGACHPYDSSICQCDNRFFYLSVQGSCLACPSDYGVVPGTAIRGADACTRCDPGTFGSHPSSCVTCPTKGCIGGSQCSFEYSGPLCSLCNPGFVYASELQACIGCSNNSGGVLALLFFLILLFTVALVALNSSDRHRPVLQIFRICIAYVQSK